MKNIGERISEFFFGRKEEMPKVDITEHLFRIPINKRTKYPTVSSDAFIEVLNKLKGSSFFLYHLEHHKKAIVIKIFRETEIEDSQKSRKSGGTKK